MDPLIEMLTSKRKKLGISRAAIAAEIGVSRRAVQFYEVGLRRPNLGRLRPWARALGFDVTLAQLPQPVHGILMLSDLTK